MLRLPNSKKLALFSALVLFWLSYSAIGGLGVADLHAQGQSSRRNQESKSEPASAEGAKAGVAAAVEVSQLALASPRPNIILINLDDADVDIFSDEMLDRYLPNIKELATGGMRFNNCHVTTPLCGPSRVCLLLGQHAHRTGIKTNLATGKMNNGFSGAYDLFKSKGYEKEHLGVWMGRAGYRTMMIGKYLHGRMNPVGIPGWDDLFMCFGGNYYTTSRYGTRFPVAERRLQTGKDEYRTVVEASEAVGMIEAQAERNGKLDAANRQPFFLYIAPLAPHLPARQTEMLERKYKDLGKDIRIPPTPDFNEADMSDKPEHLRAPKLTDSQVEGLHEEYRRRVMTTKSVDDMVGKLFETLEKTGMRKNTYIFFTSDHGYQLGHNRMIAKKLAYNRNTIIPMFVVGPNVAKGNSDHLLAHIDLTATFLDIADGTSPNPMDGKSFLPLLKDPASVETDDFRKSLLIQCWEEKGQIGSLIHCRYASLRTQSEVFTQWSNGADEYYDLKTDPYQVENKFESLSAGQRLGFEEQLRKLKQGVSSPLVTIGNPELISRMAVLEGVVEDDNSVAEVQMEIENPAKRLFWNGQAWQSDKATLLPTLANAGGLISDWSFKVDLTEVEHAGEVVVRLKAKDEQANHSELVERTFKVDAIEPKTILIKPAPNAVVESPVMIRGECGDNHQMAGVEITLQRDDDNAYWDGAQWIESEATFFKRVIQKNWHVRVPLSPGKYRTSVRSLDQAGNYDSNPKQSEFTVK